MRYLRLLVVALILCGIAGYAAFARLENAPAAEGRSRQPSAAAQPPGVAIVSATAVVQDVPTVRRSVGWVEPISTVTVRARVDGEVVQQLVQEGQIVRRGDLLFRIDDREIKAALAKDEALLLRDQATLARTQATRSAPAIWRRARSRPSSRSTRPRPTPRSPRQTCRPTRPPSTWTEFASATPRSRRRSRAASAWSG